MIGNDVVDLNLAAAESDWRRSGFLQKIFSDVEIGWIEMSRNPEFSVWNLWSRKEAAYKIFNRKTGIRTFNPLFFECIDREPNSRIRFGSDFVFCRTELSDGIIHTVASEKKDNFSRIFPVEYRQLSKIDGLPFFEQAGHKFIATASHHGKSVQCLALIDDGLDVDFSLQNSMNGTFLGNFE